MFLRLKGGIVKEFISRYLWVFFAVSFVAFLIAAIIAVYLRSLECSWLFLLTMLAALGLKNYR
jgi:hypothetical protein